MATANPTLPQSSGQTWSRSYPPILLILAVFLIAAFVLPSSLNLPQSNPSTVLEYAPVPPEDDDPPTPPEGNVSSLGLGSSGTLGRRGGQNTSIPDQPDPDRDGRGDKPQEYRCVGHKEPDGSTMIRQTEDPMSPPCVPFFEGDNFGATHQGVTKDEITVVLYIDTGSYGGEQSPSQDRFIDVFAKPKPSCPDTYPSGNPNRDSCDHVWVRAARGLANYVNERYQMYGRTIHPWIYVSGSQTESARRTDAIKIWKEKAPFAVLDIATFNGYNEAFDDSVAARNMAVFTSEAALRQDFFQKNSPRAWGFWPDTAHWADLYGSYVCQQLKGGSVEWSGNPQGSNNGFNNQPRKFGTLHTTDPAEPGLADFARRVKGILEDCDIEAVDGHYSKTGFAVDNSDAGNEQAQVVANFKTQGVTTVLWLGGIESKFTKAAAAANYYPEIAIAGDLDLDGYWANTSQDRTVWQNAFGVSFQLRMDDEEEQPGYRAYREGDPPGNENPDAYDRASYFANDIYRDFFMLGQSIQVAGPRLTPESVAAGMHAIPKNSSSNPYKAAFFFDNDDFSSIKDGMIIWWDTESVPPGTNTSRGCFKMVQGPDADVPGNGYGARSLAWEWNKNFFGGREPFADDSAPCTAHSGSLRLRPA